MHHILVRMPWSKGPGKNKRRVVNISRPSSLSNADLFEVQSVIPQGTKDSTWISTEVQRAGGWACFNNHWDQGWESKVSRQVSKLEAEIETWGKAGGQETNRGQD